MALIIPSSGAGTPEPPPSGPMFPQTRTEYITVLAHYHRAEIARMAGWRDRIDRTTNWALTVTAALLSVSLSTPTSHHGVLIFAMVIVMLLLKIEARRYRFFDVYRNRVRRLERNYYAQILAPAPAGEPNWTVQIGDDLRRPTFIVSEREAMSRRLKRNYGWIFLILLCAWLLKITSGKMQPGTGTDDVSFGLLDVVRNAALGPLPGWLVLIAVAAFYGWVGYAVARHRDRSGELVYGNVHV